AFIGLSLVFLVCGIGLWFNQQWARWVTVGLALLLAAQVGVLLATQGVTLIRIIFIICALSGAWQIWRDFSPEKIADTEDQKRPLLSFVLLLREPRYLETNILAQILSSAWGGDYSSQDGEKTGRFVVGETPVFLINSPGGFFMLNNFSRPYFDNPETV